MANRIDRFIEAMHKKQAEHLLFGTGTPVRIRVQGTEKVILDKEVRTEQILKLVQPIANGVAIDGGGESEFFYDAPSGRVHVRTMMAGDRMTAIVSPDDGSFSAPAAAVVEPEPEGLIEHNQYPQDDQPIDIMSHMQAEPEPMPVAAVEPVPVAAPAPIAAAPAAPAQQRMQIAAHTVGPKSIDKILNMLVQNGGSDLHLTTGQPPMIRKDGDIQVLPGWNERLTSDQIERWMIECANEAARGKFYETHDSDYAHEIPNVARFRMNLFRDRNGVGAVMRTIPSKVLTAEQLGLPPVIHKFCELPKGLVVVTGPTGSGKSTTLAAMVDLINKSRSDHIITIEDPVEFVHQSIKCLVNQREVHTHTESFSAALRAALREDPDIVLVGEMRDLETVHIAIETAETGHLVFGTLHTNTAPSTVDRIIDQFPTDHQAQIRVMLSESLKGVVAQTLCKKMGGGRVACLEILVVNNAISNLIREGKTFQIPSIMQTNKGQGMVTQIDSMMSLVKGKQVSPQEAYLKAVDQVMMKSALERAGHKLD
ncbi:MAG: type IV pilus twitching motility protein PilT [Deltaproteobacteria bacterium]